MQIGELTFRNVLNKAIEINNMDINFFDYSSTYTYDPFSMLYMISAIREKIKSNQGKDFEIRYPKDSQNVSYAGHMGFFKSFSFDAFGKRPGEAMGGRNYLPVTLIDVQNDFSYNDDIGIQIEKKSFALSRVLTQDDNLSKIYTYLIREMLRNSIEHSRDKKVWICAQYWPTYNLAEIGILDNGIGVRNSLESNQFFKAMIHNDEEALKLSLLPGITEEYGKRQKPYEEWQNSGYGLYVASELCTRLGGTFMIVSGDKALFKSKDKSELINTIHNGTAIRITLKPQGLPKYENVIKDIVEDGEKLAKTIKNTVKKASKSSGGLLINE